MIDRPIFLLKLAMVRMFEIDSDAICAPDAIAIFSLSADFARYLFEKHKNFKNY